MDQIADLLIASDSGDLDAEHVLLDRYRHDDGLHPGPSVLQASPYGDEPIEVPMAPALRAPDPIRLGLTRHPKTRRLWVLRSMGFVLVQPPAVGCGAGVETGPPSTMREAVLSTPGLCDAVKSVVDVMPELRRLALTDGVSLAHHVTGAGPDLVMLFPYHVNHLELTWATPLHRQGHRATG